MLKNIPPELTPDLMYVLMSMGHGDEIVLGDGNFPADSNAQRVVRSDGLDVPTILSAILTFFPLDTFETPAALVMEPVDADAPEPPIWQTFRKLLKRYEGREIELGRVAREAFYERSRKAYAIVATSETALYANLILKKGVVAPPT